MSRFRPNAHNYKTLTNTKFLKKPVEHASFVQMILHAHGITIPTSFVLALGGEGRGGSFISIIFSRKRTMTTLNNAEA